MSTAHAVTLALVAAMLPANIVGAQHVPTAPGPPAPSTRSPMDDARQCLRANSGDFAVANQCVIRVLRGRASTEPELSLLAVVYRALGRGGDAIRTMRIYLRQFPNGSRAPAFREYIANNAP